MSKGRAHHFNSLDLVSHLATLEIPLAPAGYLTWHGEAPISHPDIKYVKILGAPCRVVIISWSRVAALVGCEGAPRPLPFWAVWAVRRVSSPWQQGACGNEICKTPRTQSEPADGKN